MRNLLEINGFLSNKIIVFFIALCSISIPAFSCEICGCSGNGYHFGILPQFRKNVVGLRHTYRTFSSQHLISEQLMIKGNTSTEEFNSTELWGRFYAGKKFQLFAFVPYNHFKQFETGVTTIEQGIGDITLAANYTIFNTADDLSKDFKQTVLLGGGVKLPTGKFIMTKNGDELNPNMNSGTGSVDFLTNVIYTCRYKGIGINTDFNYRINNTNSDKFQYGNRITTSAKLFYWKNINSKVSILPNAGILFENLHQDKHHKEIQKFSGGTVTFLTGGLEVYAGKVNLGVTMNHPMSQNLSKGLVQLNNQWTASVNFMF